MSKEFGRRSFLKLAGLGLSSLIAEGCIPKRPYIPPYSPFYIPKESPTVTNTPFQPPTETSIPTKTQTPTATSTEMPTETSIPTETEFPFPTNTEIPTPDNPAPILLPLNEVIGRIETEKREFVLTIDDGWFPDVFQSMLHQLRSTGTRATFFLIWQAAQNLGKELIQQAISDGHDIGYHSLYHPEVSTVRSMSFSQWKYDYSTWNDWMKNLLGEDFYNRGVKSIARAPYGEFTASFRKMCNYFSLPMIMWDFDTYDVNQKILQRGDILLLHVIPSDMNKLQDVLNGNNITPTSLTGITE